MTRSVGYHAYAEKMRSHLSNGTDLEVDARFVDMLVPRNARVLDVGCGHGATVNALRRSGHSTFGIDPTPVVLQVALDFFEARWFRQLGTEQLSVTGLTEHGLPATYDLILMAGNVPAFLSKEALNGAFQQSASLLTPGGLLVTGTTTHSLGGPSDQDEAARDAGLMLHRRFSDWHMGDHSEQSPWSVSVFATNSGRPEFPAPDGIFILN